MKCDITFKISSIWKVVDRTFAYIFFIHKIIHFFHNSKHFTFFSSSLVKTKKNHINDSLVTSMIVKVNKFYLFFYFHFSKLFLFDYFYFIKVNNQFLASTPSASVQYTEYNKKCNHNLKSVREKYSHCKWKYELNKN